MKNDHRFVFGGVLLVVGVLAVACADRPRPSESQHESQARISCSVTADCAARGGACVGGECVAENECSSDSDCDGGLTCVADSNFGGLCTAEGAPAVPLPAWPCTFGKDCPLGQGCASDGLCHADGECTLAWTSEGYLEGDCEGGLLCVASGSNLEGFCTDGRGGPDPYCRSTGEGECRRLCANDEECSAGGACVDGFCHRADECEVDADCTPNHVCGTPEGWDDYGHGFCIAVEDPACVDDGQGACRLPCESDLDCFHGGGCGSDGLCHASNECQTDADCEAGQSCFPDPEFGGLCGVPH